MAKLRSRLRRLAGDRVASNIRSIRRQFLGLSERILFGGSTRERGLVALLASHYRSRFRRDWIHSSDPPHFWYHRAGWFRIGFEREHGGASVYSRAFYSAEVIRTGDVVLDIGCGDGFITQRFLAERAGHVDAIDIEPTAIRLARQLNSQSNIEYFQLDATSQPFPSPAYDVIIWDGAIGHFDPSTTASMLAKIRSSLKVDGIFAGSESLGPEGTDHLQHWESLQDLRHVLEPTFPHTELKEQSILIGMPGSEYLRREAYWRCALEPGRLRGLRWLGDEDIRT